LLSSEEKNAMHGKTIKTGNTFGASLERKLKKQAIF
jgi:hypothetical protein